MPFQGTVNALPALGRPGDFADHNPRTSVMAGPGGIVAGAGGLTIGRFAWLSLSSIDVNNGPAVANNFGAGAPAGILANQSQGLIGNYLAEFGMVVPAGFAVGLHSGGGFLVKNEGASQGLVGQNAFVAYASGAVSFAAAGSGSTAAMTGSIAAATATVTGSIANNVLTVTAVATGSLPVGAIISGTNVAAGTAIVSQLTGPAGGVGTYVVSIAEQSVASTAIAASYGTLTVTAVTSGVIGAGDVVTGTGVSAGTIITALGTGVGGIGTYIVNLTQTAASGALTFALTYQTKFFAMSSGAPGEIIKITSHQLG